MLYLELAVYMYFKVILLPQPVCNLATYACAMGANCAIVAPPTFTYLTPPKRKFIRLLKKGWARTAPWSREVLTVELSFLATMEWKRVLLCVSAIVSHIGETALRMSVSDINGLGRRETDRVCRVSPLCVKGLAR